MRWLEKTKSKQKDLSEWKNIKNED